MPDRPSSLDFDPLDDKYRWCVYCKADCWPDEPAHADDCPFVTGRFPVRPEPPDLGGCCRCDHKFKIGEFYRHVRIEGTADDFPGYEVVCEDCALTALIEGERSI